MSTALLIGGAGFVGKHLRHAMEEENYRVIATDSKTDIRSIEHMRVLVEEAKPDIVVNLAAITTVRETFANPLATYQIGFLGTLNLLTALKESGFRGRYLNISSSEVYGFPPESALPLTEEAPLRPMSPYAVAKVSAEALCYQWSQTELFAIMTVRPFTHIGPGQSDRFAISIFAKQIAEIMQGRRRPVVHVGNLDATRDFTDVRDTVRAYMHVLEEGCNGAIYNVCSGREVRTGALLEKLIELSGIAVEVLRDPSLTRKVEQKRILGDNSKLKAATAWQTQMSNSETLADLLAYWMSALSDEAT